MLARTLPTAEELFHAALARPAAERDRFLEDACQGDEALLHDVRSLLALHTDAGRLLGEPIPEAATQPLLLEGGTRLGHYEILERIGSGGMGEVYRARDTRLQRDVALKVLPEAFSRDAERVGRLEREARLLAALNHPHIESIHGLEHFDGRHALALELIPGETLAERIARGPSPVPEALELARQVAQALAAAHERGILHRDVKPSNVQVTPEKQAKLLDFGLAKAVEPGPTPDTGSSPAPLHTETGVVHGTAPYMSPEQARGEVLDRRTDAWSLGCVLFEALTGERAFPGETASDAIARVLEGEPRWEALPPGTPALARSLLRRCLQKDRSRRLHDLADAALELEEALEDAGREGEMLPAPSRNNRRAALWAWGPAALLFLLATWFGVERLRQPLPSALRDRPVLRSEIELTPGRPLLGRTHASSRTEVALSPDGSLLVWVSDPDPESSGLQEPGPDAALELRRLDTGEVTRLPGTAHASQPFFSPDGRWVGFFAWRADRIDDSPVAYQYSLRKLNVDEGLPIDLAEFPVGSWPVGGSWAAEGTLFLGLADGVHSIREDGGPLQRITTIDPSREVGHWLPHALPGGKALLFTARPHSLGVRSRVEAVRLSNGERKIVVEDAADARYLPTGHLVFARQGVLMAAPFDLERLELLATPVPVVEGLAQALNRSNSRCNSGALQLTVSDSGLLVYAEGGIDVRPPIDLFLLDGDGAAEPLPGFDKPLMAPQMHLSPDGRRLVFVERRSSRQSSGLAWIFDLERQTYTQLSRSGLASAPRWSPDGEWIAMHWSEAGTRGLWLVPADGRGDWERLAPEGKAPAWSPDGRFLAFRGNRDDIFLYRFADRRVLPFVAAEGLQRWPEFSPDGRWLAYTSRESGRQEVYITSFPDREHTLTVSSSVGLGPVWSRDGRRLHYVRWTDSGRRFMMAVDLQPGSPSSLGRPVPLFELPLGMLGQTPMRFYEVMPDGRFLVGVSEEQEPSPPITRLELIQNWFTELERLVPTEGTSGGL